eukprot:scaffold902_cov254-Ochromonas_danica.AAC.12
MVNIIMVIVVPFLSLRLWIETVMFLVEMMADAPWTLIDCFFYFSTLQGPSDNPFFRCSLMFIWFHRSSVQSKLYALV